MMCLPFQAEHIQWINFETENKNDYLIEITIFCCHSQHDKSRYHIDGLFCLIYAMTIMFSSSCLCKKNQLKNALGPKVLHICPCIVCLLPCGSNEFPLS